MFFLKRLTFQILQSVSFQSKNLSTFYFSSLYLILCTNISLLKSHLTLPGLSLKNAFQLVDFFAIAPP